MKISKLFLLSWKKTSMALIIFIISVFFHNLIFGLTGIEEVIFFIISVIVIPVYFIISVVYSLIIKYKTKKRWGRK